jgi:hypothetical protein
VLIVFSTAMFEITFLMLKQITKNAVDEIRLLQQNVPTAAQTVRRNFSKLYWML